MFIVFQINIDIFLAMGKIRNWESLLKQTLPNIDRLLT